MNKYRLCNKVYICAEFVFLCDGQPVKQKHKGCIFVQATHCTKVLCDREFTQKTQALCIYVF